MMKKPKGYKSPLKRAESGRPPPHRRKKSGISTFHTSDRGSRKSAAFGSEDLQIAPMFLHQLSKVSVLEGGEHTSWQVGTHPKLRGANN